MQDRDTLYKDTVKHLRVVRNVSKGHKDALGSDEIQPDCMTPYERGRMTRSCIRLGRNLEDLLEIDGQKKVVFAFMIYLDGIGVKGNQFSKGGIGSWTRLFKLGEEYILDETIKIADFENMLTHVGNMLDQPLSDAPGRITLLKLSI